MNTFQLRYFEDVSVCVCVCVHVDSCYKGVTL